MLRNQREFSFKHLYCRDCWGERRARWWIIHVDTQKIRNRIWWWSGNKFSYEY